MSEQKQEKVQLTNKEIRKDFMILSSYIYTLCKHQSTTDEEFEVKFETYDRLFKAHNNWGRGAQIGSLGLLIRYCLKGNSKMLKLTGGLLYTAWINHIFTLGSYCGLIWHLPKAVQDLDMGDQYYTGRQMSEFQGILRDRNEKEAKGEKVDSDRLILNNFYSKLAGVDFMEENNRNYVQNQYFIDNREKYTQKDAESKELYHVFTEAQPYDDELKLKYFDSFITRYVYYSFTRWGTRVGQYFGIIDEYK